MSLSRRKFTKEFKLAAVRRLEMGASVAEVARACEVNANVLHRWRREFRDGVDRAFPGLGEGVAPDRVKFWMGHRPSTPDGLPVIGAASGCADVVHAYGHGHVGLASGPMTGRLVADLISGHKPVIDPAPYSPQRFR